MRVRNFGGEFEGLFKRFLGVVRVAALPPVLGGSGQTVLTFNNSAPEVLFEQAFTD